MREHNMETLSKKLHLDDESIEHIKLAYTNPQEFLGKFGQLFWDPDDISEGELPLLALIGFLAENNLAAVIDYKESFPVVCEVVDNLLEQKGFPSLDWEELIEEYGDAFPDEVLVAINKQLKNKDITLARIEDDSADYVVIVVKRDEMEEIKACAKKAGYEIFEVL